MLNKEEIKTKIKEILAGRHEVIFAYIHGSFKGTHFRDIDIAVYVDETVKSPEYELSLSLKIEKVIRIPVDVRILNSSPLSFRYSAIKGELLISRDDEIRFRFIERTLMEYLDFKPVEERIIKELLAA